MYRTVPVLYCNDRTVLYFVDVAPNYPKYRYRTVPYGTAARAVRIVPYRISQVRYGTVKKPDCNFAKKQYLLAYLTGKEKIHMYLFLGLQAADDLSWSRIDFTVSDLLRVMFFYIVQIGATWRVFGRYFSIR